MVTWRPERAFRMTTPTGPGHDRIGLSATVGRARRPKGARGRDIAPPRRVGVPSPTGPAAEALSYWPAACQTVVTLQNSRIPCPDNSRPYPDRLIPPKGNAGCDAVIPLKNTPPA